MTSTQGTDGHEGVEDLHYSIYFTNMLMRSCPSRITMHFLVPESCYGLLSAPELS